MDAGSFFARLPNGSRLALGESHQRLRCRLLPFRSSLICRMLPVTAARRQRSSCLPVSGELREIVRTAVAQRTPLTLAGAGTGLTGARVPHGGCVVSLERFRKLEIEQGHCRCGAGVLLNDLHQAAARARQFFGPNPTEGSASIGGIFSTNAGGARSFRYGSVRHHALAVEVTFLDGETKAVREGPGG